jgi:integrase
LVSALTKEDPHASSKVAWRVLDVWAKEQPPSQAPAMPGVVAWALFSTFWLGFSQQAAAMIVMSCFVGLLRIGEGLRLRDHEVLISAPNEAPLVMLLLGRTKRGLEQRVCLRHPVVVETFRLYRRRHSFAPRDPFFPGLTYGSFRSLLDRACRVLGLGGVHFRTHSLRRGGATALFSAGVPWSDILTHGRWSSERSAREYIRRGEAWGMKLLHGLPDPTMRRLEALAGVAARAPLL